jgi:hypothetical protein
MTMSTEHEFVSPDAGPSLSVLFRSFRGQSAFSCVESPLRYSVVCRLDQQEPDDEHRAR